MFDVREGRFEDELADALSNPRVLAFLEAWYQEHGLPDVDTTLEIAGEVGLTARQTVFVALLFDRYRQMAERSGERG